MIWTGVNRRRVNQPITVTVRVTSVAEAIPILISLRRISTAGAVVIGIIYPVAVGINPDSKVIVIDPVVRIHVLPAKAAWITIVAEPIAI